MGDNVEESLRCQLPRAIWQPPWSRIFPPATKFTACSIPRVHCVQTEPVDHGKTKGKNAPKVKFAQAGPKRSNCSFLRHLCRGSDVRQHTDGLWKMMKVADDKKNPRNNKSEPPHVAFRWGQFEFQAVITSLSQSFTLFDKDGLPCAPPWTSPSSKSKIAATLAGKTLPPAGSYRQDPHRAGRRAAGLDRRPGLRGCFTVAIDCARQSHHPPLRLRQGQQLIVPPLE